METKEVLIALAFLAGGIGVGVLGWNMYQTQQADVQQAVEVEGTVEGTDIDRNDRTEGTDSYEPVVSYTYSFEGQQYSAESVYPGAEKQFSFRDEAREVTDQYSSGQTVTVYVNEEDPSRAFLINETSTFKPLFAMGIGGLFALIGALLSWGVITGDGEEETT